MASKKQFTYEVTVFTLGGGEFTATDTETAKAGYSAWQSFLRGDVIEIPGESGTTYVPYHAIDHIVVASESTDATYTDDTCNTGTAIFFPDGEIPAEPENPNA